MNITTNNLAVGYGTHVVQRDLTFSLQAGETVALLGPNGVGKTTLLRTLAGLLPALGGSIAPALNEKNMALVLTERIDMPHATVYDVVATGRYPYTSFLGTLTTEDEQAVQRAIAAVGCQSDGLFDALSDGEKQRVLIAKALAQETDLILLDEPTAHLDLPNRIHTFRLLRDLAHSQGKTILISTHELDLALQLSDRILLLHPDGFYLDTADRLRAQKAFEKAFQMDVFNYKA